MNAAVAGEDRTEPGMAVVGPLDGVASFEAGEAGFAASPAPAPCAVEIEAIAASEQVATPASFATRPRGSTVVACESSCSWSSRLNRNTNGE